MSAFSRVLAACALLGATVLATGCGDDRRRVSFDAAVDTGRDEDAGDSDASLPLDAGPVDAGPPPPICQGSATGCGALGVASCNTVMGCRPTRCVGFALRCAMRSMTECMAGTGTGCSWNGTGCVGTALACPVLSDEAVCRVNTGCSWSTLEVCRGEPLACETFMRETCETQPGCSIDGVPRDAGTPDDDAGSPDDAGPPPAP